MPTPDNKKVLAIGFLVVLWWVGIWGIIELAVQNFSKGSSTKAFFAYAAMVLFVILILYLKPTTIEHFL
jgi:hypothetical protein